MTHNEASTGLLGIPEQKSYTGMEIRPKHIAKWIDSLPRAQQQASWINNLDTPEKKPKVQKTHLNSFIRDGPPPQPPVLSQKSPKNSTRSSFIDNITRDKESGGKGMQTDRD